MYELSVEDYFAAAHKLRHYQGECENLHGHNWRVRVELAAEELDGLGMVMDFRDLKKALKDVLSELDHTYLNEREPFDAVNPTTENICRRIAGLMSERLPVAVRLARVWCWESEKCGACYVPAGG